MLCTNHKGMAVTGMTNEETRMMNEIRMTKHKQTISKGGESPGLFPLSSPPGPFLEIAPRSS